MSKGKGLRHPAQPLSLRQIIAYFSQLIHYSRSNHHSRHSNKTRTDSSTYIRANPDIPQLPLQSDPQGQFP